jgi:hypothetical protein
VHAHLPRRPSFPFPFPPIGFLQVASAQEPGRTPRARSVRGHGVTLWFRLLERIRRHGMAWGADAEWD